VLGLVVGDAVGQRDLRVWVAQLQVVVYNDNPITRVSCDLMDRASALIFPAFWHSTPAVFLFSAVVHVLMTSFSVA